MPDLARPTVYLDIVEEHFEELDFLWEQRESVIFAPDWTLEELAELEERAEAHLDGLRLAQGHGVDISRPALAGDQTGAATAATLTMMEAGVAELDSELLMALAAGTDEVREGIGIGLRHCDIRRILPRLGELSKQAEPAVRIAAVEVLAFHRQPPPQGLPELIHQADPGARARIYAALRRFGGPWSVDPVKRALESQDGVLQRAALETSAHIGLPGLAQICRQAAVRSTNPSSAAVAFLGVLGEDQDVALMRQAIDRPDLAQAALAGLGALGRSSAIPVVLDAMRHPELALAAGEAFRRITGAEDIDASAPLPHPEGLSAEEVELAEPVTPPDPDKAREWWEREKGRFHAEGRWQIGLEVSKTPLGGVFNQLPLAFRRDVYVGLRAGDAANTPDIELERRARDQMPRP